MEEELITTKEEVSNVISDNVITTNIEWDATTIETIDKVAEALLNLTRLFRMQNIEITGIKVETKKEEEINEQTI